MDYPAVALGERAKISLMMIVRDEEENLPHGLESVRDVFDEIVVVDTGSTDRTFEIARSFGARAFDFVWVDSFSADRNEALSHTTGYYAFWLDSDDVVEPPEKEKLLALLAALARPAGAHTESGDLTVGHSGGDGTPAQRRGTCWSSAFRRISLIRTESKGTA